MITKKAKKEFVRHMLETNTVWQKHALMKIYSFQTDTEQCYGTTNEYNYIGFTGADAEILSSFAVQLEQKGYLSPKQMQIVAKKMKKYWKQILTVADQKKILKGMVAAGFATENEVFMECI
jgi:hypothetical protein